MYKIDFRPVGTDRRLTLSHSPVDTPDEAVVIAKAKVSKYLDSTRPTLEQVTGSMFDVTVDGEYVGDLFLRKL